MAFIVGFGLPIAACVVGIWLMAGRANAALARSIAIALLPGIVAGAVVTRLARDNDVFKFYASSLRGSLFSGFLSLGAFMFSLKTFILVNMKTGVYDNDRYRQRVENARTAAPNTPVKVYGSLERLRSLLFWSILTSLSTAVLQMTLGLVDRQVTVAIALGAVGASLGFLGQALFHINANLKMWFEFLEEDVDAKRAKLMEAKAKVADDEAARAKVATTEAAAKAAAANAATKLSDAKRAREKAVEAEAEARAAEDEAAAKNAEALAALAAKGADPEPPKEK